MRTVRAGVRSRGGPRRTALALLALATGAGAGGRADPAAAAPATPAPPQGPPRATADHPPRGSVSHRAHGWEALVERERAEAQPAVARAGGRARGLAFAPRHHACLDPRMARSVPIFDGHNDTHPSHAAQNHLESSPSP
jgi:hypothetical protein